LPLRHLEIELFFIEVFSSISLSDTHKLIILLAKSFWIIPNLDLTLSAILSAFSLNVH